MSHMSSVDTLGALKSHPTNPIVKLQVKGVDNLIITPKIRCLTLIVEIVSEKLNQNIDP